MSSVSFSTPPVRRRRLCASLVAAALVSMSLTVSSSAPVFAESSAIAASDLAQGSVGPRVAVVQEALMAKGAYLPGGADGVFGDATTKAIADFQTWNGITRTGTLDARTLRALGLASSSTSTAATSSTPAPAAGSSSGYSSLSLGSQGAAVVELQKALLRTGLVIKGGADGVFGAATQRALKAYQRVNGMSETGSMSRRAAELLRLGQPGSTSSTRSSVAGPASNATVRLERFPVQGYCAFGDTWRAPRGDGRVHEGVDIIAPTGKLLYAVADGTITTQYWDYPGRRSGNGLKLTTADGTYFVYLHLSGFAPGIARGTKVDAGDVLGSVGNTGASATPHLHFEIHPGGGAPVSPYPYVKAINDCSDTKARYS
jgi:murein DD-endopeptidase MepM/ murein hydrolase activator NlpD